MTLRLEVISMLKTGFPAFSTINIYFFTLFLNLTANNNWYKSQLYIPLLAVMVTTCHRYTTVIVEEMITYFKVIFFMVASVFFSSRNVPGPVGWRDAARLRNSPECPVWHGGHHPLTTSHLHKLSALWFRTQ